jgi:DNA-binding NarL/FixJ family response regulator
VTSERSRVPRVLIADDEDLIRDALELLVAAEGFEVVACVGGGSDAVAGAREFDPDVVLMDLRMPGMGGIEAARLIHSRSPWTQVIILTAYDDHSLSELASDEKTYAHLLKGCPPSDILDTVHRAWERCEAVRRKARRGKINAAGSWIR